MYCDLKTNSLILTHAGSGLGCNSKTLGSFGYGDIAPLAFDVELAEEDFGPDLVLVSVFVRSGKHFHRGGWKRGTAVGAGALGGMVVVVQFGFAVDAHALATAEQASVVFGVIGSLLETDGATARGAERRHA